MAESCRSVSLTLSRAGVFIAKARRSRVPRRVVAEPFQERISAGSLPEVSRLRRGPSCPRPGAFPGHSASPAAPAAPRRPVRAWARQALGGSGERRSAQGPAKCRWPRIEAGCERSELAGGRFSKSVHSVESAPPDADPTGPEWTRVELGWER